MNWLKNKKIFGLISFLDIIIVIVICILLFIAYYVISGSNLKPKSGEIREVTYTIEMKEKEEGYATTAKVGDELYDIQKGGKLGKIVEIKSVPAKKYTFNNEKNIYEEVIIPNRIDITAIIKAENANYTDSDIALDEFFVKNGTKFDGKAKGYALSGYIIDVERKDA